MKTAFRAIAFSVLLLALIPASQAFAACTSPAGETGGITWNGTNAIIWCDGTTWNSLAGGAAGITALTGDVTASGPGSTAATIANGAVTYAKMQNASAASVLLGRGAGAGAGTIQELTLGSGLSLSGTTLSATAAGTVSGTTNYVAKFTGASAVGNSLIYDNGTNVGIGTTSPGVKLDVRGGISLQSTLAKATLSNYDGDVTTSFNIGGAASSNTRLLSLHANSSGTQGSAAGLGGEIFGVYAHNGAAFISTLSANNSGNVGIGTASPTLARLQTAGTVGNTAAMFASDTTGVALMAGTPGVGFNSYYASGDKAIASGYGATLNFNTTAGALRYRVSSTSGAAGAALTANEVFTVLQSGNVGIGTNAPADKLSVIGRAQIVGDSNYTLALSNSYDLALLTNATNRRLLFGGNGNGYSIQSTELSTGNNVVLALNPAGGNVGIGTTVPSVPLDVAGSIRSNAPTGPAMLYLNSVAGQESGLLFQEGGVHKWELYKAASNVFSLWYGPTNRTAWTVATNGDMTIYGSVVTCVIGSGMGATNCTSDRRLKKDITQISGALDKLLQITGVSFHWKDPAKAEPEHLGVIAQEVEAVYPQAVIEVDNPTLGKAKAVDIAVLVSPIIEAIRELKGMIDNLATKVENVIARVFILEESTMPLAKAVQELMAENGRLRAQLTAANDNDAEQDAAIDELRREIQALNAAR